MIFDSEPSRAEPSRAQAEPSRAGASPSFTERAKQKMTLLFKNLSFYDELCTAPFKAEIHGKSKKKMRTFAWPVPARAEPSRAEPEPSQAESNRAKPSRAEASRGEPSRAQPSRAGPSRAEPIRAGPGRAEPSRAGPNRAEPSRARAEPRRAEPSWGLYFHMCVLRVFFTGWGSLFGRFVCSIFIGRPHIISWNFKNF